jgi:hypothetical protein
MATATQSALSRLSELQARASEIESKFQQDLAELELQRSGSLASLADEIDECSEEIRVAASNSQMNGQTVKITSSASTAKPVLKKKPGRRPKVVQQTAKKRGRPAGVKNKPKGGNDAPVAAASNAVKGVMKCEDAILHVLGQSQSTWKKHVTDLPSNVAGLKVIELTKVMIDSGLWTTDSKNPEQQVSQRLADLREQGKVVRGDQMRYTLKA